MKEVCIINYVSKASVYGIGSYLKEYVYCLKRSGCKINLIELGTDKSFTDVHIKEENNVCTMYIPYTTKGMIDKYNKSVCRLLRLYIKDSNNLIFHFHYMQSESLLDSIKKYFPLSKSILTIHYLSWSQILQENEILRFKKIVRQQGNEKIEKKYQHTIDLIKKEKTFLEKADHVICLSEDTLNLVHNLYQVQTKLWLIPNGLRKQYSNLLEKQKHILRDKYYLNPEEKILLFVGRIDSIKGIYPLLSCFDYVLKNYPNCRLVMVGDGNINEAIRKSKKILSKVIFTGKLDKKTVRQWYQIADIALFPSFYEECSYVGIEMMMHGLPIVASDGYSVRNMFHDGLNARVAKCGRTNKCFEHHLRTTILEMLNSDLSNLKKRAQNVYMSKYTVKFMQNGYMRLFNSI